jgi:hypothetical protein
MNSTPYTISHYRNMLLSKGTRLYIAKYISIYKRIKEAKRWENDRFLLQATNKPKAVWNELGKLSTIKQDTTFVTQSEEITAE